MVTYKPINTKYDWLLKLWIREGDVELNNIELGAEKDSKYQQRTIACEIEYWCG